MSEEQIQEMIENYLKENLQIEIRERSGFYNEKSIEVKIKLNDKVISEDSWSLS